MADEYILTMIRAAQQAPMARDKDRILQVILDDLLSGKTAPLGNVVFPLPVYFMSKKLGRKVEGALFEDKSIEVEGKRWPSPSSNGMCDIVLGYHTTMWPVWKYVGADGKPHSIDHLRRPGGPFEAKEKPAR
ncbi:hypothetical protein LCGC14_1114650 [marine sediment metagenome]|uniref:Uncharacterized protein n=1 Tax=marine sediment metagenome TaxID=412755 RepID=A0A0F9M5P4_9ZZZZ